MTDGFLVPRPDEDSTPFWESCAAGELRIQACAACGRRRMPPRPMCPWCHSLELRWDLMSGRGRVWSFVIAHPPLLAAYAEVAPYNVAVIELEDDPSIRLVGNLTSAPDAAWVSGEASTIEIGQAGRVSFGDPVDGIALPRWVRSRDAAPE